MPRSYLISGYWACNRIARSSLTDRSDTTARRENPVGRQLWQTVMDVGVLSAGGVFPVFRAVAQLIFDLRLRPMVIEHAVHIADTARIRLAAEHILVCGSHDRLRLLPRHRSIGLTRSVALASPLRGAARAARISFPVAPTLIS